MTVQPAITPSDRLRQAAEREMIDFERREIEFRKKERSERAAELRLPIEKHEIHWHREARPPQLAPGRSTE
jgi:hypothetical protein